MAASTAPCSPTTWARGPSGRAYTISGATEFGEVRYKPFGVTRYTSGTTPTTFRYTGQREESSLGLYYYGARWYDPALGRFIQADTLVPHPGDPKAFDRYAYVLNNPFKYTDPSGHGDCPLADTGFSDLIGGPDASSCPAGGSAVELISESSGSFEEG